MLCLVSMNISGRGWSEVRMTSLSSIVPEQNYTAVVLRMPKELNVQNFAYSRFQWAYIHCIYFSPSIPIHLLSCSAIKTDRNPPITAHWHDLSNLWLILIHRCDMKQRLACISCDWLISNSTWKDDAKGCREIANRHVHVTLKAGVIHTCTPVLYAINYW